MNLQAAQSNKKVLYAKMKNHINQHRKSNISQSLYKKDPNQEEERTISATFAKEQAKNFK